MLGNLLREALRAMAANKLRTFLTMLGMVIGVGAVILMLAIGQGAQFVGQANHRHDGQQPVHRPVRQRLPRPACAPAAGMHRP